MTQKISSQIKFNLLNDYILRNSSYTVSAILYAFRFLSVIYHTKHLHDESVRDSDVGWLPYLHFVHASNPSL
jgi:hypothetical protein